MSTSKVPRGTALRIDTGAKSTKYLGEPGDRHFVPRSPLISRQILTSREEEALQKACRNVLSGVQHSDSTTSNEFQHLAAHIVANSAKSQRSQRDIRGQRNTNRKQPTYSTNHRTELGFGAAEDSATPSTISKPDLFDRTSISTPATSIEVTPKDRFPARASKFSSAHICYLSKSPSSNQPVYTFLHETSNDSEHASPVAARSMTNLSASNSKSTLHHTSRKSYSSRGSHPFSKPEYNKSLPDVPRLQNRYQTTLIPHLDEDRVNLHPGKTPRVNGDHVVTSINAQRWNTDPQESSSGKAKFSISALFKRKKRQHSKQLSIP